MKKLISLLMLAVFTAAASGIAFGRTMEEEKIAIRDYLKVIDSKIIKYRKARSASKVKILQEQKRATLGRWEALKKSMEAPPQPAPVYQQPYYPPQYPVYVPPAASAYVPPQKLGIIACASAGLNAGLKGVNGHIDYEIPSILPNASLRIGGNYIQGTNPSGGDDIKAVSFKAGAIYGINEYVKSLAGLPLDWYVGGNVIIPVKVNKSRSGKWGGEAFVGSIYKMQDIGSIFGEIGYSVLKYSDNQPALKGLLLNAGYSYSF